MRRADHSSRGVLLSVVCLSVIVKPLKGKPWLGMGRRTKGGIYIYIYTDPVCIAQYTHSVSVIQTSQLMLYREIIAVCSQIHTKHINTLCVQNVELYRKTQSVPHSKHTPSQLYKPVS